MRVITVGDEVTTADEATEITLPVGGLSSLSHAYIRKAHDVYSEDSGVTEKDLTVVEETPDANLYIQLSAHNKVKLYLTTAETPLAVEDQLVLEAEMIGEFGPEP